VKQLSFDDEAISDAECKAIAKDMARQQLEAESDLVRTTGRPKPCVCDHPLVFATELGTGRCGLCGRERSR
jgi:hypothetical protein